MNTPEPLVVRVRGGLYCPHGDFWIDPLRPVETALITHAHADHARSGSGTYWCAERGAELLQQRVDPGRQAELQAVPFGEQRLINGVRCSWHSAGHVLGSAQIRLEADGQVWVVTGDYKRAPDPSCDPFEVVECDVLVSEATFGVPVYRWPAGEAVARDALAWWRGNAAKGVPSVLYAYSLGKAQRLLAHFEALGGVDGPLLVHRAAANLSRAYARQGVALGDWAVFDPDDVARTPKGALIIAPPSSDGGHWLKRLKARTAYVSGWMRVRGNRRRRAVDRGFIMSDHADWPALVRTVQQSKARQVHILHNPTDTLAHYLSDVLGIPAGPLPEGDGP